MRVMQLHAKIWFFMCGCLRRQMQKIKIPKNQNPSSHPHPDGSGEDPTIMGPMPVDPAIVSSMAADPAVAGLVEVDPSTIGYRAARCWPSRAEPVPEEARVGRRPLLPTTRCCGAEPAACRPTPKVPPPPPKPRSPPPPPASVAARHWERRGWERDLLKWEIDGERMRMKTFEVLRRTREGKSDFSWITKRPACKNCFAVYKYTCRFL